MYPDELTDEERHLLEELKQLTNQVLDAVETGDITLQQSAVVKGSLYVYHETDNGQPRYFVLTRDGRRGIAFDFDGEVIPGLLVKTIKSLIDVLTEWLDSIK